MRIWLFVAALCWIHTTSPASADDALAKQRFLACSQNIDLSACDELVAMPDISDIVRSNAFAVRGMTRIRLGDTAGGEMDVREALVINPDNSIAQKILDQIAKMTSQQGDRAEADCVKHLPVELRLAACDRLVENSKSDPKRQALALDIRSAVYLDSGRFKEAIDDLKRARQLAPDYDDARQHLITAIFWSGDYSAALQETKAALGNPGSLSVANLFHYEGALLYLTGQKTESLEAFHNAYASNPMSVVASFWVAIVSLEQGKDVKQSLQDMSQNPLLGDFGMTLAGFRLGNDPEAKVLEQANAVPEGARQEALCMAYFNIGHKAWLEGNTEKARRSFAAAVDTGQLKLTEYHAAKMLLAKL